ncbi:hypothetical protein K8I28_11770 [bacterium]|nr:hypothetical protein [bacterium]
MVKPANIPASLKRLFRGQEKIKVPEAEKWKTWFSSPLVQNSKLILARAGEVDFDSQILDVQMEESSLLLIIDRLLPTPDLDFWTGNVTFDARNTYIEDGIEVTTTFRTSIVDRYENEGRDVIILGSLQEIEVASEEYVAQLGAAHELELWMFWYDDWIQVNLEAITVSRFLFAAELEHEFDISPDGVAVPQARLVMEKDGPEIPMQLHLFRRQSGEFEAKLEKIDGIARQKLISIIEEIWRIAAGLSTRSIDKSKNLGYRSGSYDALAEAFKPHIVFLGDDQSWIDRLEKFGPVRTVAGMSPEAVAASVRKLRCDLVVGDGDIWGEEAIKVERVLRSTRKLSQIPRIWLVSAESLTEPKFDFVNFGAFDVINRSEAESKSTRWLNWCLQGDSIGSGAGLAVITNDPRVRYRLGRLLGSASIKVLPCDRPEGMLQFLQETNPKWVLLDGSGFYEDVDAMLNISLQWSKPSGASLFCMVKSIQPDRAVDWLQRGVKDIILMDPSLEEAAERIREKSLGI